MSSGNKLTAVTTSTLSLLQERQHLQATHPTLHLKQITSNIKAIRAGVMEARERGDDTVAETFRIQYERLVDMLGVQEATAAGLER